MLGLVQPELAAAGQPDRAHETEPLVRDRTRDIGSTRAQLGDRRVDVVAHEVELVPAVFVRGMGRQLGRRQAEDQPATAGVHGRELEHVSEEPAIRIRVSREEHCMRAGDHLQPPSQSIPVTAYQSGFLQICPAL